MYLQNRFMQNSPLGYDKDELITVDISRIQKSRDVFANELKTYAGIEEVTFGEKLVANNYDEGRWRWGVTYQGEDLLFSVISVHYSFLKVMGIEITEGRDFREEDVNTQSGVYIFNETARKKFHLELGSSFLHDAMDNNGEIIGFIPDIKFTSFRDAVDPMAFCMLPDGDPEIAYIKLKAGTNIRAAMSHIHSTLARFDKEYQFFEIRFFDEVLQRLYEKEIALSSLITLFSLIAIFISIVGVFGLVVFDSECRRKEVAIRKVFGASVTKIIVMFNKAYFKILLICFVVAVPIAWYAVNRWLENFAYKTPMYWWIYLLAFVAVAAITAGTVTLQNWKVANEDPIKNIKTE
jgi:putative ABC transport system permease protein